MINLRKIEEVKERLVAEFNPEKKYLDLMIGGLPQKIVILTL